MMILWLFGPVVRFSQVARTFRVRNISSGFFGSRNTRTCLELSSDIFGNLLALPAAIMRAKKLILEHGFIIITFNFSS